MLDFHTIDGFDWDEGNARKSNHKHGVTQVEAEQVFFNLPALVIPDLRHSKDEPRFHLLGRTNAERMLHITFTLRFGGRKIRVISARELHRKERRIYEEKTQDHSEV